MRFKTFVMSVMLIGLVVATAQGADITGTWILELGGQGAPTVNQTFELKADGASLTGTMHFGMGKPNPISEGKIDGDNISFVVAITNFSGKDIKLKYKGKVTGDEMELAREMEGRGGGFGDFGSDEMHSGIAKRVK